MLTPLLIVLATASTGACPNGFGVVYDEMHSFKVTAPAGWCCDVKAHTCSSPSHPKQLLRLSFSYLSKERDGSYEAALTKKLSSLPGNVTESPSITTKQGRTLKAWSAIDKDGGGQLVAFMLQEGVCLVQMSLESLDQKITPELKRAFTAFVASYEGSK